MIQTGWPGTVRCRKSQVQKDLLQAVAGGDLPNARLQEDGTLYLDLNHIAPPAQAPEETRTRGGAGG